VQASAAVLDFPPPPAQPPLLVMGERVTPPDALDSPVGFQLLVSDSRNLVDWEGVADGILLNRFYTVPAEADWSAPDPQFPGYALWQRPYNQMLRDLTTQKLISANNVLVLAGFNLDHRMAPTSGMESVLLNAGAGDALLAWCESEAASTPAIRTASWGTDQQVSGVGLSESPSAVVLGDTLILLHQGSGESGQLWFSTFDGASWSGDRLVNGLGMSASPCGVVYNGRCFVFHQGYAQNGQLWYATFDGSTFANDQQVPGLGMSEGPSAVVYDGRLYVFHQGYGENGQLWYDTFDGSSWSGDRQVPGTGMSASPSAVVFDGRLYVFHQGIGQNGQLWFNTFDGSSWSGDQQVPGVGLSDSPCAVAFAGQLVCFHQGAGESGRLWSIAYDGQRFGADQQVTNLGMSRGPSAAILGGRLYVFHQGFGQNGQLWYDVQTSGRWIENATSYLLVGTFGQGQRTGFERIAVATAGTPASLAASIYFYRQVYGGQYTLGAA
jgi:hypothetical protein